ncbi:MAG: hypothetical protein WDO73_26810, partial [Ignavibacteriota bacterium]
MKQWKAAVFGTGFMGRVHTEAIRRLGNVEVVAVASLDVSSERRLAEQFFVQQVESDYRKVSGESGGRRSAYLRTERPAFS